MRIVIDTSKHVPTPKDIAVELERLGIGFGLIMDVLGISQPTAKKVLRGDSTLPLEWAIALISLIATTNDLVEINASSLGLDENGKRPGVQVAQA